MTNLGFHQAMAAAGVNVHTVGVGDRYVLEALDAQGWALGGEQSGHIVFRSLATTGDGVLSGLLLADLVTRQRHHLADMAAAALERCPQVLRNVAVADRDGLAEAAAVWDEVQAAEREPGPTGPGPAAPERHRAPGPGHGRSTDPRGRRRRRRAHRLGFAHRPRRSQPASRARRAATL